MAQLIRVLAHNPDDLTSPVERFYLDGTPIRLARDVEVDPDWMHKLGAAQWRHNMQNRAHGLPEVAQRQLAQFVEATIEYGQVYDDVVK